MSKLSAIIQSLKTRLTHILQKFQAILTPLLHNSVSFCKKHKTILLRLALILFILLLLLRFFGRNFLPPKIVYTFPDKSGTEIPLDTKIEVVFDRPVVKSQVVRAFVITPKIDGRISWSGDNRLQFSPTSTLSRGSTYTISFKNLIFSKFFIPGKITSFSFKSIGDPRVVLASPQNELPGDFAPITVVFDRPMIPLTTATNSAEKLPAFTIIPKVEGSGRWLGTTSYQFQPEKKYRRATTYAIKFVPNLKSLDGGNLPDDFNWSFSSPRPKVENISPLRDYAYASPTASVSAVFSQNIDPDSITSRFKLYDDKNTEIMGRVVVSGRKVGFYPAKALTRSKIYKAVLHAGIQSIEGPNGLESDYSWNFTTAPVPQVVSTNPANGTTEKDFDSYSASININFNSHMSEKSLSGITVSPAPESKYTAYLSWNETAANIFVSLSPKTTYTVTIPTTVKDQYGIPLSKAYVFKFTTGEKPLSISVYPVNTYFAAFNQTVTPRVIAQVFGAAKVDYSLHSLSKDAFLDLYRRRNGTACSPQDYNCSNWQNYDFAKNPKINSWSEAITEVPNASYRMITKVTNSDGSNLSSGFYYLDMRLPDGKHDGLVMIVSQSVLTLKKSSNQILVWAVDQSTGQTISDMDLEILNQYGNTFGSGITNKDGVWLKELDKLPENDMFIFGHKGNDLVVISDDWGNGINRYDFGLPYYSAGYRWSGSATDPHQLFVYPDRPIYRPGQKVYFQGLVRKDNDGIFSQVNTDSKVSVSIVDSRGRNLYSQSLVLNSFGSYSGEVLLSPDADLGQYQINADFQNNSFSQPFQVEEYKKPEVSVSITLTKDHYLNGDTLDATVNAAYYFGAPVANAPVTWSLQTQDMSFTWSKNWRYEFGSPDDYWSMPWWDYEGSYYYSGQQITSGRGVTDANGQLQVRIPLNISKYSAAQKMVLEAVVNDVSNQSIAASNTFSVYKAGIYAGLSPERYGGKASEEQKISVVTVNVDGQEVPHQKVNLTFAKRNWESIRVQDPDTGEFRYKSTMTDVVKNTQSIETDDLGYGKASFTPDTGGTYIVTAKVADAFGNVNISGTYLWISGPEYSSPMENNDRIKLIPDKSQYRVGENASLFIDSPYATDSAKTLLTMERGKVLDYRVVDTSETSNNFSFPIPDSYAPNLYLSALLVRPGSSINKPAEFKMGLTQISVINPAKHLNIKLTSDKPRYQPGNTMKLNIDVTDDLNRPVKTEVSLGVVDQAVWDLSTVNLSDIYQVFYQPRSLGVETTQLLTISLDRINANTNLGSKGGSGGGGEDGGFDTSRKNFPDTAFWKPDLVTNDQGHAEVTITLPDSLTTWRIVAVGNTQSSAFGGNYAKIIVTRDVLVRPFLPRFLAVADNALLGTIVSNTTDSSQTVTAKISASGLNISGSNTQTKTVSANSSTKFTWNTVAQATTSAQIKLSLNSLSNYTDSAVYTLPVNTYFTPEVVSSSGIADPTSVEDLKLPTDVISDMGGLTVNLSSRLGNLNPQILEYLFNYSYYCAEQSSSKLLPFVYYHDVLGNHPELADHINSLVQRLTNLQHPDGGWGWWIEGESQPYLTAIAYQSLSFQSRHAGKTTTPVDQKILNKAANYLKQKLSQNSALLDDNTRAFVLYVLKDSQENLSGFAANLYTHLENLSISSKAYLALASRNLSGFSNRYQKLLSEIESLAIKTSTTTHWEDKKAGTYFGSNTTTTAAVLELLLTEKPKHPYVSQTLRYLNSAQSDGRYQTTRENAAVIIALSVLNDKNPKSKSDLGFRLNLSGDTLKTGTITKAQSLATQNIFIPMKDLKLKADNRLEISKSGSGTLYYNLNLKYFLPFAEREAFDQGIVIVRDFVDKNGKLLSISKIRENSEVWVKLTLVAPSERRHVVIEDFLPAGLEAVNTNLKNVSSDTADITMDDYWNNSYYFGHTEYHDDKVSLFAEYLPAGMYEFTYRARATTPGTYHYPAATAYEMYTPDVSGHSSSGFLTITPK